MWGVWLVRRPPPHGRQASASPGRREEVVVWRPYDDDDVDVAVGRRREDAITTTTTTTADAFASTPTGAESNVDDGGAWKSLAFVVGTDERVVEASPCASSGRRSVTTTTARSAVIRACQQRGRRLRRALTSALSRVTATPTAAEARADVGSCLCA